MNGRQPVIGGVTSNKVHAIHQEYVINVSLSSGMHRDRAWGAEVGVIFPKVGKSSSPLTKEISTE